MATEEKTEDDGGKAVSVLSLAQEQADRIRSDAQSQAQETIRLAQEEKAALLLGAEHEATRVREQAEQEAKRIRSEAQTDAEQTVALALREGIKAAADLPAAVLSEVAEYRALSTTLKGYLGQHLTLTQNLLNSWEAAETDAQERVAQARGDVGTPDAAKKPVTRSTSRK